MKWLIYSAWLVAASSWAAPEGVTRYPSGLIETFYSNSQESVRDSSRNDPETAVRRFIDREFGSIRSDFSWEKNNVLRDQTHIHAGFALKYRNRSVVDRGLKINVTQSGEVESATSNFAWPFDLYLPDPAVTAERETALKNKLWKEWEARLGPIKGGIRTEPVIWVDPQTGMGYPAFDVRVILDSPGIIRRYILHEETGNILEEKNTFRSVSAAARVYKVSPFASTTTDAVTLTGLDNTSSLRNSYVWVRRERSARATAETIEVIPGDYTNQGIPPVCTGFSVQNATGIPTVDVYNTCGATAAACCNMAFNAVNAYYHISNFRTRINTYLTQLGATVNWTYDAPVHASTGETNTFSVLINPVSIDFGHQDEKYPGDPDAYNNNVNNALYSGEPCRFDGSMERCLVFLKPAALSSGSSSGTCGVSSATLFDLSREAIVVAHEYQHYVTDMITRIAFSSSGSPKVGDAIHEGYSDYMAASYVTDLAERDVTLVGQYALQQCTPIQRQLATLRPYNDADSSNEDVHLSGLSWASAFWKLRTEFGASVADRLALKSLFFLSTTPGFLESIEAVVQADQAVFEGAHVARIRTLFYSEISFTGKNSFPASGVGEIGFKGCGAVHGAKRPAHLTLLIVFCYFASLLFFGRIAFRRKKIQ